VPADGTGARLATQLEGREADLVCFYFTVFERALIDRHGEKARQEIRNLLGRFKVEADEREIRFYNEQDRHEAVLLRAVGATNARIAAKLNRWVIPSPGST
jgi:hypothetical protein